MSATRSKPVPGHKLASINYGVFVRCECGWGSETTYGKGARQDAFAQWRGHQDQCLRAGGRRPVASDPAA